MTRFLPPTVLLVTWGVLLLGSACGGPKEDMVVHTDAPYFATLDELSANSTVVVEGTVVGTLGRFDLRGTDLPFAQDAYTFQVDNVLSQTGEGRRLAPLDVIVVSTLAVSDRETDVSNMEELRAEVASFSGPLDIGDRLTLFLSPLDDSLAPASGWGIVGSSYGVIAHEGPALRSRAPLGPLRADVITASQLGSALDSIGTLRPGSMGDQTIGP